MSTARGPLSLLRKLQGRVVRETIADWWVAGVVCILEVRASLVRSSLRLIIKTMLNSETLVNMSHQHRIRGSKIESALPAGPPFLRVPMKRKPNIEAEVGQSQMDTQYSSWLAG